MTVATLKIQDYKLLTLFLSSTSGQALREALASKLSEASVSQWVQSQPIVINYAQASDCQDLKLAELKTIAEEMNFLIVGVTGGDNKDINKQLLDLGQHPFNSTQRSSSELEAKAEIVAEAEPEKDETTELATEFNPENTLIHVGTVRSGTRLYAKNKSLVVIGNVGNGADVMADDCIYIFGSARGRIMAGGSCNKTSVVYCKDFNPELISIGGVYKTSEDIANEFVGRHVLAKLNADSFDFKVQD